MNEHIETTDPKIISTTTPCPADGTKLLNELRDCFQRFVILPKHAPDTLALWTLHTYAFELRGVTTYLGVGSPEKRCGKSTLLGVLSDLVNRPVIWEPLLVLADLAGGPWPEFARTAALALSGPSQESGTATLLIRDIQMMFEYSNVDRIFSREIVRILGNVPERPWNISRTKPITEMWLAAQLRPYGIKPKNIWLDQEVGRGYERADFNEAFTRYVTGAPKTFSPSTPDCPSP